MFFLVYKKVCAKKGTGPDHRYPVHRDLAPFVKGITTEESPVFQG